MKLPTGFAEHLFNKLFKKSSQREKEREDGRERERERGDKGMQGKVKKNERIESNCLADCNENERETS